ALLLRDDYFRRPGQTGFKYLTIGVLFVNISIGGVLTAYAAPPVLMVAQTFGWDTAYMATHFGWRAALAVLINASMLTWVCRVQLRSGEIGAGMAQAASTPDGQASGTEPSQAQEQDQRPPVPWIVVAIHLVFLVGIVLSAHHPVVFLGILM